MSAIRCSQFTLVFFCLVWSCTGYLPSGVDAQDSTTIVEAIEDGDIKLVQQLLEQGASANATDEHGDPLVVLALENKDLVRHLIAEGADVNVWDRHGDPLIILALEDRELALRAILG